ncbi:PH domain-containing protein [Leucobacter triazinivorans]|uniref:PH domain-containing protein n=1 Tax=Leucobacter triazinivorans TaxID=1784719 RepID=A0A4P6KES0_9MICO|nr:PH domain-containing protein [Leucobacter triazinivorans]QBE48620.1 PH domain-containing protein [Leucobacter triazinivorans]
MSTPRSVTAEVESILGPAPAGYTQPEAVVLRFRRHGWRLAPPVIALAAVAAAAGYWVGNLPEAWMNLLAAGVAVLLGLLLGVLPVLAWLAHRTTITTRRVIVRRGLFVHQRSELALGRVREVKTRRGVLQRVRGAGDIELLHGAESLRLDDLPGVQGIADALRELVERNYVHATRLEQRLAASVAGAAPAPGGSLDAGAGPDPDPDSARGFF